VDDSVLPLWSFLWFNDGAVADREGGRELLK